MPWDFYAKMSIAGFLAGSKELGCYQVLVPIESGTFWGNTNMHCLLAAPSEWEGRVGLLSVCQLNMTIQVYG